MPARPSSRRHRPAEILFANSRIVSGYVGGGRDHAMCRARTGLATRSAPARRDQTEAWSEGLDRARDEIRRPRSAAGSDQSSFLQQKATWWPMPTAGASAPSATCEREGHQVQGGEGPPAAPLLGEGAGRAYRLTPRRRSGEQEVYWQDVAEGEALPTLVI